MSPISLAGQSNSSLAASEEAASVHRICQLPEKGGNEYGFGEPNESIRSSSKRSDNRLRADSSRSRSA